MRSCFCPFSFYGSTDYGPSKDGRGLANGVSTDSSGCCWKNGREPFATNLRMETPDLSSGSLSSKLCPYVDYLWLEIESSEKYYGACKLVTEYFQYGSVVRRTYHNQDGTIAFEESRLGGSWLYKLGSEILTNHTEVMRRFCRSCR